MADLSYPDIVFSPPDAYDDVSSFHATGGNWKYFLQEDALDNPANRRFVTFPATWNDMIVGYFTLVNDSIVAEAGDKSDREPSWKYRKYPAIRIARMARHRDFSGHGTGTIMLRAGFHHCPARLAIHGLPDHYH